MGNLIKKGQNNAFYPIYQQFINTHTNAKSFYSKEIPACAGMTNWRAGMTTDGYDIFRILLRPSVLAKYSTSSAFTKNWEKWA